MDIKDITKLFCGACLASLATAAGGAYRDKIDSDTMRDAIRTNPIKNCTNLRVTSKEFSLQCNNSQNISPLTLTRKESTTVDGGKLLNTNPSENAAMSFSIGEFKITTDVQSRELNKYFAGVNRLIEQQSTGRQPIIFLEGSSDPIGDATLNKTFPDQFCGARNFKDIEVHYPVNGSNNTYAKQLASYPITNVTNKSLPNLRARTLQCWLSAKYPNMKVEILHGGVQPVVGEEFRAVKIKLAFEDQTNITANGRANSPSSD